MIKSSLYIIGAILLVLVLLWILGPKPSVLSLSTELPDVPSDLQALETHILEREALIPHIKADNEARIIWAEGYQYKKSPCSLVYLHGFSASQGEGEPIHREFAERYGCNLYLARLQEHGLEKDEALLEMTPEGLMVSANHAIAVGNMLGEKTYVMSTSTGSTLALYIAAEHPDLAGLICYSPNIDIKDPQSAFLVKPWGLQIARMILGGKYRVVESASKEEDIYWYNTYRLEALVALKSLVNATMKEAVFNQVTCPLLLVYYYKSEEEQDDIVSVPRMMEMFDQLGTPEDQKRKVALPNVGTHPLASIYTTQDLDAVRKATFEFSEEILMLNPGDVAQDSVQVQSP